MMAAKHIDTQQELYCYSVGQAILPAAAFQAAPLWGRMESCAPVGNRRCTARSPSLGKRVTNPCEPQ